MKKILAISGSPRTNGNTERLISKIVEGAAGASSEFINLDRLNISGCKSCYACRKDNKCVVKDNMQEIYKKIDEADTIILGSPIYMWQMTAQAKLFTDRLLPYLKSDYTSMFGSKGKDMILVYTYGQPDPSGFQDYIDSTAKMYELLGFNIKHILKGHGTSAHDDIEKNSEIMSKALSIGAELV